MRTKTKLLAALATAGALCVAATALADVAVYTNAFNNQDSVNAIKQLGGGKCERDWFEEKALQLRVDGGRESCVYRTPVEGDAKQPNYSISASGNVSQEIDKKIRRDVYVGVSVRTSTKGGYVLRIFPKGHRWQFLRNGSIVESGDEKSIKGLGDKNFFYIAAKGDTVDFGLKTKSLGSFRDPRADDLDGKRTAIILGNIKQAKKDGIATFDNLKVSVPD